MPKDKLIRSILILNLISFFVFPTILSELNFLLTLFLFIYIVFAKNNLKIILNNICLKDQILYGSLLFLFCLYGLIRNYPGAYPLTRLYLIAPLIISFIFGVFNNYLKKHDLIRILIISVYLIFIVTLFNLISPAFSEFLGIRDGVNQIIGRTISYPGVRTIYFAAPFLFCFFARTNSHDLKKIINISFYYFAMLICLILLFLNFSGTSIFIMSSSITILLIESIKNTVLKLPKIKYRELILFIILILVFIISFILFRTQLNNLFIISLRIFGISSEVSDLKRTFQFEKLFQSFLLSPFFGNGLGIDNQLYRSERPWDSELSYLNTLNQLGIIGITPLFLLHFNPFYKIILKCSFSLLNLRKLFKLNYYISYSFALGIVVICGSVNPILSSIDNTLIFFFPILFINSFSEYY
tara:strand:+ start:307 stop:1542 length:1236 start_codon:yes stop_codon:yes gene_type:complete